jgi:hypothetical protein
VYCSRDLEDRVVSAFDKAGVEAYLRVGSATGNKFLPEGQVPRTMTWEAVMYVIPAAEEGVISAVVEELEAYAGSCEIEPCLRMVVGTVQEVH